MAILGGGQRIMIVLDEDAVLEETTRSRLATVYRARISEAIAAYRRDRRPTTLWLHTVYALCATGLLLLSAFILRRIVGLLRPALERRYRTHLEGFEDR